MKRFSIIIPVYNAEAYLAECLESILSQASDDLELICVDDGSTDRSGEILALYAQKDPRVRIVSQDNAGPSQARNAGMHIATGNLLWFVDADDWLEPGALARISEVFEDSGADIVSFGFRCEPAEKTPASLMDSLVPHAGSFEGFHPELLFTHKVRPFAWRCVLSRAFCLQHDVHFDPQLSLGDDQFFLFYVYPRARKVELLDEQLYVYRMSDQSLMHAASAQASQLRDKLAKHQAAVAAVLLDWQQQGWIESYARELLAWALDLVLLDAAHLSEADQSSFWRHYLELLETRFGVSAMQAAHSSSARVIRDIRLRLSGHRTGPCVRMRSLAQFYLAQRGLVACIRRVVRSRF